MVARKGMFRYLIYIKLLRLIHVIQEEHATGVSDALSIFLPILYNRGAISAQYMDATSYTKRYQGRNTRMALLEDGHIRNNVWYGPNGAWEKCLQKSVARRPGRSGATI